MKKRICSLVCVLALALGILSLSALGAPTTTVYLLATNDKMCDLPNGALPILVNGTVYVPYTVFDKEATHTDLGVYYGIRQDRDVILNLYSLNNNLTFAVSQGTCVDRDGNKMNFQAVIRNGIPYVPAKAVCTFFDLQYSFLPTPDRGTLIRICNSSARLSDTIFLNAASNAMLSWYNDIIQSMEPQPSALPTPTPTATPTPTPGPSSSPPANSKENVRAYLAVDASEADQDLTSLFGNTRVLFLFTPDSLAGQSDLVRSAVGAGHSIGLVVSGTLEEAREQLRQGNDLLKHIARTRTRIVSAPDDLTETLSQEGWSCWTPNVSGSTASTLLANLDTRRTYGRLTLPPNAHTIEQVLTQIRADRYTLRQPLETNL